MSLITTFQVPRRVLHSWDLVWNLVTRDFRVRYKDSVLGVAWAVVIPLVQLLIFFFLFKMVLALEIRRYSSSTFIGLLVWGWFSASLNESVQVLKNNRDLVEQPGFPAGVLPVVSVTTNLMGFLIAMPLMLGIVLIEGGVIDAVVLFMPVLLAIEFMLTLGLAYVFAAINAAFRDTRHLLAVGLQLYFFLTPIFYDINSVPTEYRPLFDLNPMVHLVQAYRAVLMHASTPDWESLAWVVLFSLVTLALGMRLYDWSRYRYLEEL